MPIGVQRLIFQGKVMKDDKKLHEFGKRFIPVKVPTWGRHAEDGFPRGDLPG